jgi:hypothetical protein
MNRLFAFLGVAVLAAGSAALVGCGSNHPAMMSSNSSNAYAGGNGAFGEDPVNPGEHARDRFMSAVEASAQSPAHAQ